MTGEEGVTGEGEVIGDMQWSFLMSLDFSKGGRYGSMAK